MQTKTNKPKNYAHCWEQRENGDHSARFCNTEQKVKGKFESHFIFHFNLSLTHQIFREPAILSHCICPSAEVQMCINMGCDLKKENRSQECENCQLPAFLPKDRDIYTLPGLLHSHLSRSPSASCSFHLCPGSQSLPPLHSLSFLSLLYLQSQNASFSPNFKTSKA